MLLFTIINWCPQNIFNGNKRDLNFLFGGREWDGVEVLANWVSL